MSFTSRLAIEYNMPLFAVLSEDRDNVVLAMNYYIKKADHMPELEAPRSAKKSAEKVRKVTSATATGGWY